MSSSSRLGLSARELLRARRTAPQRVTPLSADCSRLLRTNRSMPLAASFTTSPRHGSKVPRMAMANASAASRTSQQMAPKTEISKRTRENLGEVSAEALSMMLPGTFILPPLSQFPKSLYEKLKFMGYWSLIKGQEIITNAAVIFGSKPSIFTRARFKAKRSTVIPTAKALHRAMAEALAAGDKDTINRVCTRNFAAPLLASIDARPRGRRYGWELVRYTNKLLYPSLKSHKMSPMSRERNAPIVRQAVVAIASRQRRVEYDARGDVVPGSEKEMDAVEYVTMGCIVDPRSWEQGEWRIVGTVRPTTLEAWNKESALLKVMLQQGH